MCVLEPVIGKEGSWEIPDAKKALLKATFFRVFPFCPGIRLYWREALTGRCSG